jgi:hypothetical protein
LRTAQDSIAEAHQLADDDVGVEVRVAAARIPLRERGSDQAGDVTCATPPWPRRVSAACCCNPATASMTASACACSIAAAMARGAMAQKHGHALHGGEGEVVAGNGGRRGVRDTRQMPGRLPGVGRRAAGRSANMARATWARMAARSEGASCDSGDGPSGP